MLMRLITTRRVILFGLTIIGLLLMSLGGASNAQTAPSMDLIQPYLDAPLCPSHNDTAWHGLWDYQLGCHYDHTHNDDPNTVSHIFQEKHTVSYPWMTPNENNLAGHQGYKYAVKQNIVPSQSGFGDGNYIDAFRVQYHDAGGNAHMVKRFHSYYMEAQIKSRDGSVIGIVRTGGHSDFGCLHVPYKEFVVPIPGDPDVCFQGIVPPPPYRAASTLNQIEIFWRGQLDNKWIWNSRSEFGWNQISSFVFRTLDSWTGMDPNDPSTNHFVCPPDAVHCKYNNSEHHVFTVFVTVPASLDSDRDGIVNFSGFTDVKGNIVTNCTEAGPNCVPLEIVNAPVGLAYWRLLGGPRTTGDVICDHDVYFTASGEYAGQVCDDNPRPDLIPSGWIQFLGHTHDSPGGTPPSPGTFISTEINPTSLDVGGTALVTVNLNNVPVEGYKSGEFTCSYDAGLVEKGNITATNLFGPDPVVAIHDPQTGTFIVAIAGTNSNKATTSGPAFTFSVSGLQAGQTLIQCSARVSKGDNMPIDVPSTSADLAIGFDPSSTPLPLPIGSIRGQVTASKPVTLSLLDENSEDITSVPANPDGTYSLAALAGEYTLVASASGFLSHQGTVIVTGGGSVTELPVVHLLAGDVDGNNVIDQFDALTIGMSYTTSSPTEADLNNDGVIDFLDLELLAENYRMTGPTVWE